MLAAGLPLRCVSISAAGGYDTHADQEASLPREPQDHHARACWPSSATSRRAAWPTACWSHVWSEFGRRPEENGSGTDHGAGGASFLIGTRARARWWASSPA